MNCNAAPDHSLELALHLQSVHNALDPQDEELRVPARHALGLLPRRRARRAAQRGAWSPCGPQVVPSDTLDL